MLIATGGIAGQGDFGVLHRAHVGFGPGHVEEVGGSGGGGRRCAAGGCTACGATGGLRGSRSKLKPSGTTETIVY